jgi:hypothetical protein
MKKRRSLKKIHKKSFFLNWLRFLSLLYPVAQKIIQKPVTNLKSRKIDKNLECEAYNELSFTQCITECQFKTAFEFHKIIFFTVINFYYCM